MVSLLLIKVVAKVTAVAAAAGGPVQVQVVPQERLAASLLAKDLLHLKPIQLVKRVALPTPRLAAVTTTPHTTDHRTATPQWLLPCKLRWEALHSSSQPRLSQD